MFDNPLSSATACFEREVRLGDVVKVIDAMDDWTDGASINIRSKISHGVPHWRSTKELNPFRSEDS
jgi:hypothetical protein